VPGDVERALTALWPLAQARLTHPRGWWRWWRLHRRFSLRFVRIGELSVKIPYGQVPDCEACTELCCTGDNAIVSLRLRDIAALMDIGRAAHITHERDVRTVRSARSSRAVTTSKQAARTTWARTEADASVFHRVFPTLVRDATGTCSLLSDARTCSVWPAWPLSCARYPYALDLQNRVVFYAKGCTSTQTMTTSEAPVKVRELVRAVVDAYNERIKDIILVHMAREELRELGLLAHLQLDALK
jgi:hypothetical protein